MKNKQSINMQSLIIQDPDDGCIIKIEYRGAELYYGKRIFFDGDGNTEYEEEVALTRSELRHLKADLWTIDETLELLSNME